MRYTASFLGEADREQVHEASLRILAEAGVRFHGERALPLLAAAGARVDAEAGIARFPRALVEAALATAPRAFVLGARNPVHDYALPSPVTRYAIDGTAAFAIDFETGERRYGTRRDSELALRVFQAGRHGRDGLGAGHRVRRAGRDPRAPRVRGDGRGPPPSTASTSSTPGSRCPTSPRR